MRRRTLALTGAFKDAVVIAAAPKEHERREGQTSKKAHYGVVHVIVLPFAAAISSSRVFAFVTRAPSTA